MMAEPRRPVVERPIAVTPSRAAHRLRGPHVPPCPSSASRPLRRRAVCALVAAALLPLGHASAQQPSLRPDAEPAARARSIRRRFPPTATADLTQVARPRGPGPGHAALLLRPRARARRPAARRRDRRAVAVRRATAAITMPATTACRATTISRATASRRPTPRAATRSRRSGRCPTAGDRRTCTCGVRPGGGPDAHHADLHRRRRAWPATACWPASSKRHARAADDGARSGAGREPGALARTFDFVLR